MTSIITNASAIAALSTLRTISSNMSDTQGHISSGLKVQTAADNAAYWSIATTMKSDNKALGAVADALGLAAAKTDTAYTGLNTAIDVVTQIKAKLVAAREPGVDKDKINKEITELRNQLLSTAQSASFSGENWLYNTSTTAPQIKTMVASFTRSGSGSVSIGTIAYDTSTSTLVDTSNAQRGQLTMDVAGYNSAGTASATYFLVNANSTTTASGNAIAVSSGTTDNQVEQMLNAVETMLRNLTNAAANIGAANARIDLQNTFINDLRDTITKGVGRLVDADMNEESTKLKALQTQQQLGIQALSIANSSADSVLSLFR
ncbi:flagellin [Rhizobium rhizosphaerae]|uniref:Flagellin n=1 Tax=Xaviernesmea rhizosphaerae TaxID=1672749 RepID=A0A1Q9AQD6_9HYPH|nr:flagellin [Xaviernesmea rhizosphaerae]OLP57628.1 flagellin [Xaviernesmea rhizosphaerae]OQP84171.1 flagellin [Xaviernesmea rhizosphaerae]